MFVPEFKKLWQPILLVVALCLTVVYYRQTLFFIYEMWPNGGVVPEYEQFRSIQETYGNKLTGENWQELQAEHQHNLAEVNQLLAASPLSQSYQVTDYAEFQQLEEKTLHFGPDAELNDEEKQLATDIGRMRDSLINKQGESLDLKLVLFERLAAGYEAFNTQEKVYDEQLIPLSQTEKAKLDQHLFNGDEKWRTLLPHSLPQLTAGHFNEVFLLLMLLLSILMPHIFVRDQLLGLTKTQWSSQRGRRLVSTQAAVNGVGSLLLIVGVVFYYGSKYLQTDFTRYFASGLTSFLAERHRTAFSFFDWTFGQWFYLIIGLTCLLSFAFAGILFFYAQTSKNYLSLLLKLIPTIVLTYFVSSYILKDAFYVNNKLYQLTGIPLSELYLTIILFIFGMVMGLIPILKSRTEDLLS